MATRPNILWIVTTQWRGQALGVAGDPDARTPRLDRLAAAATHFRQAVTPHPFGPFARAAMLTGVLSPANGVADYFDPLPRETQTVAHRLKELGYATAFFGKWHLGERARDVALVGEAHAKTIVPSAARGGFAFWEGFESGFLLNDPWLHGTARAVPQQVKGYQSRVLCERAAAWLAESAPAGAPWFAVVSLEPPHPPYDAPADGVKARAPGEIGLAGNVPRGGDVEAKARRELAGYHAHVEATDRAVGALVDYVDACDQAAGADGAGTVVVFTSVHGDMHGAHGLFRKGWPHEESVRVPLLVRGPREMGFEAGVSSSELVSLVDLPRWTVAWAEGGRRDVSGRGRGATLQRISMPSVVALPHQCDRRWRGVRTATRKLVLNADGSPWLLFDLENDPLEMQNLVDDPAWRAERERLRTWVDEASRD